ncbi:MAG: TMEM175 family protein [Gemmatimonadota bacterium]|nr:DUF1211 domain-containing protein [Gemmatimonadota bacterium]
MSAEPDPLATVPRDRSGFRPRGLETTRLETFTDAAFAFSLTLLVVSLEPPTDFAALARALRDVPAFVMSGALLMVFWWGHEQWSRRYGLDDGPAVLLSTGLVFTVLIYVYPLRFVFGLMLSWLSQLTGLPLGSQTVAVTGPEDVNRLFLLYGVGFTAMCGWLTGLYVHAWRRRDALRLDAVEAWETRAGAGSWALLGSTGLLSILIAAIVPPSYLGLPGWAYMLSAFLMPAYARWADRRRPSPAGAAPPGP